MAAPGPWARTFWDMLELPNRIVIRDSAGKIHENIKMWTYWCLEEGTLGVAPEVGMNNVGQLPPITHVDTDAPLYSSEDGSLITDRMWGIYYKPDFHFAGIQGGAMPYIVDRPEVNVDPYGIDSPDFVVGPDFAHMWTSAWTINPYDEMAREWAAVLAAQFNGSLATGCTAIQLKEGGVEIVRPVLGGRFEARLCLSSFDRNDKAQPFGVILSGCP